MEDFDEEGIHDFSNSQPSPTKTKKNGSSATKSPKHKKKIALSPKAKKDPKKPGAKNTSKNCLARSCEEERYRKTRWCSLHNRASIAMGKQAGAKGDEEKTVFEKAMKEDSSSADLMDEWEKVNPAHQK